PKKAAPATKKASPAAASKKAAPATKKASPAAASKKAAPATKKASPAAATKKATTSKASALGGANGAAAPARSTFTPKPKPPAPVRPKTGPYAKDAKFLEEMRESLQGERAIYQEQATSLRAE